MSTDVIPSVLPPAREGELWFVVHCRPRCEKKVAEFCDTKQVAHYLPLMKKSRRYGKRVRVYEHPVFAGYLFVLTHTAGRALLRQYQRVANVLDVADQQTLIAQLHQIKTALDQNEAFELFPHLTAGTRVKVQAGPLKGVEGFVVRLKNKTRIVLNIDFIQQALAVEVEAEWLLPV